MAVSINKKHELEKIAEEITRCSFCKKETTGKAVPGEGNENAKVFFVGEAPGKKEADTGRPFVGRSGQLLRKLIRSIGLLEKDVFITSVGKYLPLSGTPTKTQILHGREHLFRQIDIVNPKIVVLLGAVAVEGVLKEKIAVTKMHGIVREENGRTYFLTIHPAAALRFPPMSKILEEDFSILKSKTAAL